MSEHQQDYFLQDVTVIDAASFLAGPGAATVMADYGARVIKIEPPRGDGYRTLVGPYPIPYHWQLTSRNKRSVALDLTQAEGRAVLHRLVEQADVITTNFLHSQLRRYELEYERLKALNPRLIFAHVSGYGDAGEERERRAFDVTAWWARSGMMEFIRAQGGPPQSAAPGMGDHATAMSLFSAIMAGLYRRERTGEGCRVSTSLLANGAWANGMALQGVIAGNDLGRYKQEQGWLNPFTSVYQCADGRYLVLAMINPAREWPQLCQALGHPEWCQDERFADMRTLMSNRAQLIDLIQATFSQLNEAQAHAQLDAHGVTYGRIAPMGDVVTDAQMRANGIVVATGDPGDDYPLTISSPINIDQEAKRPPQRAPDVGAHTREVLTEFGFMEGELDSLLAQGAVLQS